MRENLQQFRFSSLAENWGVHTKLIYKYQILYLDRITIVMSRTVSADGLVIAVVVSVIILVVVVLVL